MPTDSQSNQGIDLAAEQPVGLHIHIEEKRIFIEGAVASSAEKESLLTACRSMAGKRDLIDRVAIMIPER